MSEIFELANQVLPVYINLVAMMLFVGFNLSLLINAKLYTKEENIKNNLNEIYLHFVTKHLIPILLALFLYAISIFEIYDFQSKNPFYVSIKDIALTIFACMCINYIYIVIRAYVIKKNATKNESVVCAENFKIVIYYFVILNLIMYFSILFLNLLLSRLY